MKNRLVVLASLLIFGCQVEVHEKTGGSPGGGGVATPEVAGTGRRVNLERGVFRGDLRVTGSDNDISGAGGEETVIEGDLKVTGSGNRIHGLSVKGDIKITGDDNDVTGVRCTGSVKATGRDNRY